jgi:hypothetical protein
MAASQTVACKPSAETGVDFDAVIIGAGISGLYPFASIAKRGGGRIPASWPWTSESSPGRIRPRRSELEQRSVNLTIALTPKPAQLT